MSGCFFFVKSLYNFLLLMFSVDRGQNSKRLMRYLSILVDKYMIKKYFFRFLKFIKVIIFHFPFQKTKEGFGDYIVLIISFSAIIPLNFVAEQIFSSFIRAIIGPSVQMKNKPLENPYNQSIWKEQLHCSFNACLT